MDSSPKQPRVNHIELLFRGNRCSFFLEDHRLGLLIWDCGSALFLEMNPIRELPLSIGSVQVCLTHTTANFRSCYKTRED